MPVVWLIIGLVSSVFVAGCDSGSPTAVPASSPLVPATPTGMAGVTPSHESPRAGAAATLPPGIAHQDLTFRFDDGWLAQGQLTFPSTAAGPLPVVILVPGSGPNDMDETVPESVSGVPGGSHIFLQIADDLPARGFAVVRYNKRGVTAVGPQIDHSPQGRKNQTVTQYIGDTAAVLHQIQPNPRIDLQRVILLGHSEGTLVVSHLVTTSAGVPVAGIILMGVAGYDIKTVLTYEGVDKYLLHAAQVIDTNKDGQLSVAEVTAWLTTLNGPAQKANSQLFFGTDTPGRVFSRTVDPDGDSQVTIATELRAVFYARSHLATFPAITADPAQTAYFQDAEQNGSVRTTLPGYPRPVLLLNGETDVETVVQGARDVDAALTHAGNPDHTLITYPGLGHTFSPGTGLNPPLGPLHPQVLTDISTWLSRRFLSGTQG